MIALSRLWDEAHIMTAPFGIELFSAADQLEILNDLGQGKFMVSPPKPHPSFDAYVVQATPKLGVVWIKAITPTILNDAYGNQIRQTVNALKSQLVMRYGEAPTTDFLMTGSIWDEPRDWAQALAANERSYYVIWDRPNARGLPEDLSSVYLGASGIDGNSANICIEYASSKMSDAEAEIEMMLSDLL